ncbi:MAG: SMP-30/gluconolactonase/LRE family protein [Acidobacteriota bacterium]|nr:SMP-30/gluconolactonase/LRE family protein [Acidobacteriota bacterium]
MRTYGFIRIAAGLAFAIVLTPASSALAQAVITVDGMSTPESALHDPEADVYLVSNINGAPGDKDDNGFITRVSPDGDILDLKWIDGADDDVTLHGPKGSAVHGNRFYVADIDVVRVFDRSSGAPVATWEVSNAGFLNDVAVGADGTVYVTDTGITITAQGFQPTGTAAIYRFDTNGNAEAIARGDALSLPNGVIEAPQGLVMVPVGSNAVMTVAADGTLSTLVELPQGQLDGVVVAADGSLVVSSFGANVIYQVTPSGDVIELISDTPAADIGIDVGRSRVLIPQLDTNRLLIVPVELE